MRFINVLTMCVVLILCGCKQNPDAPDPQSTATEKTSAPSPDMSVTTDNGMLTLDPAFLSSCAGAPDIIATQVKWDASATGTEGAEIWLQSVGEEKKLWAATGATGSGETGPWMRVGSMVILVDGRNKQELARLALGSRPCDR